MCDFVLFLKLLTIWNSIMWLWSYDPKREILHICGTKNYCYTFTYIFKFDHQSDSDMRLVVNENNIKSPCYSFFSQIPIVYTTKWLSAMHLESGKWKFWYLSMQGRPGGRGRGAMPPPPFWRFFLKLINALKHKMST